MTKRGRSHLEGVTSQGRNRLRAFGRKAAPADAVPATRSITAGVGLSGGGDFSANRTIDLEDTAVTPGSYTAADITVDQQGRITAAASGAGGGGGNFQDEAQYNYPDLTGWATWFQQGTSAVAHDAAGSTISWQTGVNIRSLTTTIPSIPFDVYMRASWVNRSGTMHAGLCLRQSTNNKHIGVNVIPNTQFYVQSYDGNSFDNNWSNIDVRQDSASMWFRIRVNSTSNMDFYVSNDGILWSPVGTAVNPSAFFTPNRMGIWMRCDTGAPICRVSYFDTVAPSV